MRDILASRDLVIVFAQAIAGLGHLRVTHALYDGLPEGAHAVLLGTKDANITAIHNLTSQSIMLRRVVEFFQAGPPQDVFAYLYTAWLRAHTADLTLQLQTIVDRHPHVPKTVLVVATHFGLAHQFAKIKRVLEKEHALRMVLVVVVTDDAPFSVWAVNGADITVVPSDHTKWALTRYHRARHFAPGEYIVLPYMVSPRLTAPLSPNAQRARVGQLAPDSRAAIHVAVPIAGAAVQLTYLQDLIRELNARSSRFLFHIVSKLSKRTEAFLARVSTEKNVDLLVSSQDREVVDLYERLYEQEIIALEVTKPSEQAFKALISPKQRGGSILLFSEPVGLQEKLNLAFLERHGLLPKSALSMHPDALRRFRSVRLPATASESAACIMQCLTNNVFAAMADFAGYEKNPGIADDGVARFWDLMRERLASV